MSAQKEIGSSSEVPAVGSSSVMPTQDEGSGEALLAPVGSLEGAPAARRWGTQLAAGAVGLALVAASALAVHTSVGATTGVPGAIDSTGPVALYAFDRGHVICGGPQLCDCSWASGGRDGSCATRANDQTPCWSCCCQQYFKDDYDRVMRSRGGEHYRKSDSESDRESGREMNYRRDSYKGNPQDLEEGDWVVVQGMSGRWKHATVLRRSGHHAYTVRLENGHRVTVPADRILPAPYNTWYWVLLQGLFWICMLAACAGGIMFLLKKTQKPQTPRPVAALLPKEEPKPARTCTWCEGADR